MRSKLRWLLLVCLMAVPHAQAANESWPPVSLADPRHFVPTDGATLYRIVCQGCHMPGGAGAQGAGSYPALAKNPHLQISTYPASIVLNGLHAMPRFGGQLSDQQVAAVVDYVRSHFGNHYQDKIPVSLVSALRQ
jgi:mono/diheme cytochrome c family protein